MCGICMVYMESIYNAVDFSYILLMNNFRTYYDCTFSFILFSYKKYMLCLWRKCTMQLLIYIVSAEYIRPLNIIKKVCIFINRIYQEWSVLPGSVLYSDLYTYCIWLNNLFIIQNEDFFSNYHASMRHYTLSTDAVTECI